MMHARINEALYPILTTTLYRQIRVQCHEQHWDWLFKAYAREPLLRHSTCVHLLKSRLRSVCLVFWTVDKSIQRLFPLTSTQRSQ